MPWTWTAKTNNKAGEGKNKGGSGNGSPKAAGSGGAAAGESAMDRKLKQLQKQMEKEAKEFATFKKETAVKLRAAGERSSKQEAVAKPAKKLWTCGSCGDEKCFESRAECHRCGTTRAGAPTKAAPPKAAAVKAAPAAAAPELPPGSQEEAVKMETEVVPVESRIARLEAELKVVRLGAMPESKALVTTYEQSLKLAREEQRLARPLPARYQAATDKTVKLRLQQAELEGKAKSVQEQRAAAMKAFDEKLEAIAKETAENGAKLAEADQELAAVKADLAAEQPGPAAAASIAAGPVSPLMVARICDLLAQRVQGVKLNPEFLVELALVMDPRATAAMGAAPAAAAAAGAGGATASVSQAGVWASRQAEALATANGAWEVLTAQLQQAADHAAAHTVALAAGQAAALAPASTAGPAAAATLAAPLPDGQLQGMTAPEAFGAVAGRLSSERASPYGQLSGLLLAAA